MINKKGQWGTIAIIGIILFLLVGITIAGVIVANKNGLFGDKKDTIKPPTLNLYLKAVNSDNPEISQDANYMIDYTSSNDGNKTIESSGILTANSYTPIEGIRADVITHVRCWNENSYLNTANLIFGTNEVNSNISTEDCKLFQIGNLEVNHIGDFRTSKLSDIKLNLTSRDGSFYKIGLCFAWTAGIIDTNIKGSISTCQDGIWKNYSFYNITSKKYTQLKDGTYLCGEDNFQECESVSGSLCKPKTMNIPKRLENKVDSCQYLGDILDPNKNKIIDLEVKSDDFKNELDNLKIYIIDSDRRFDYSVQDFRWTNGEMEDIAAPDIIYQINYAS